VVDLGAIPIGVASLEITLATGGADLDIQLWAFPFSRPPLPPAPSPASLPQSIAHVPPTYGHDTYIPKFYIHALTLSQSLTDGISN
jgi:hypothetical protein